MLVVICGPSCSGKSSLANRLSDMTKTPVWSGRDYVRLDHEQSKAWGKFSSLMLEASTTENLDESSIIYISTDLSWIGQHFHRNPFFILIQLTASLEVLQHRFSERLGGRLPDPIIRMLEKQLSRLDHVPVNLAFDSEKQSKEEIFQTVLQHLTSMGYSPTDI